MKSNLVSMEAARTDEAVKPCKGPVSAGQRVCIHLSLGLSGTQPCAYGKGIHRFWKHWANDLSNLPRELLLRDDIHCPSLWEVGTGPLKEFQPNDPATSWVSKFYWNYLVRDHTVNIKPYVVSACRVSKHTEFGFLPVLPLALLLFSEFLPFPRFQINFFTIHTTDLNEICTEH